MITQRTTSSQPMTRGRNAVAIQQAMEVATAQAAPQRWICEVCGMKHGVIAPDVCDSCGSEQLVPQQQSNTEIGSRW